MTLDDKDNPKPTLGFVINDVARLIRKRFEQMSRDSGLTRAQWQVLAHLRLRDGIRQGALADILELEPISLSRVVDRLEAAGFVERRPDATDRRSKRLFLQAEAHPQLQKLMEIADYTKAEVLRDIPPEDVERMMQTLLVMRRNLVRVCGSEAQEKGEDRIPEDKTPELVDE